MAVFKFQNGSTGLKPDEFYQELNRKFAAALNEEATRLETEVVAQTPSGVSGRLRQGWVVVMAKPNNLTAVVGQSSQYFLPVEMGRQPGKGISEKGQKSVRRWAKLVLGLKPKAQKNFAFLLSQKYKSQGRPAVGFLGLAIPGSIPDRQEVPEDPISNSLLDNAFQRLRDSLDRI